MIMNESVSRLLDFSISLYLGLLFFIFYTSNSIMIV